VRLVSSSVSGLPVSDDICITHKEGTYYVYGPDMLWAAEAGIGARLGQPRQIGAQSIGNNSILLSAGEVTGSSQDGSTLRIGVVADPDDAAKPCWLMRVHSNDADTAGTGAKRSEIAPRLDSEARGMLMGQRYVIGLAQRLPTWAGTTDEQLTFQFKGDDSIGASPWLAHYVLGSNRRLRLLYSLNPDQSGLVSQDLFAGSVSPNTWERWVIEVIESQTAGLVRAWLNGQMVVDYAGPVGYQEPNGRGAYWKQGVYHWTVGNAWDDAIPVREVWQKGAYVSKVMSVAAMDAVFQLL